MIPTLTKEDMASCVTVESHTIITRKEKQQKITFLNNNKRDVNIVKIDGCIQALAQHSKADYAFVVRFAVWYVELKASDGSHALQQLGNTVDAFKNLHTGYSKTCVLTCAVPAHGGKAAQRQIAFKKRSGADLFARSKPIIAIS